MGAEFLPRTHLLGYRMLIQNLERSRAFVVAIDEGLVLGLLCHAPAGRTLGVGDQVWTPTGSGRTCVTLTVHEVSRKLFKRKQSRVIWLAPSADQWQAKFSKYLQAISSDTVEFWPYS